MKRRLTSLVICLFAALVVNKPLMYIQITIILIGLIPVWIADVMFAKAQFPTTKTLWTRVMTIGMTIMLLTPTVDLFRYALHNWQYAIMLPLYPVVLFILYKVAAFLVWGMTRAVNPVYWERRVGTTVINKIHGDDRMYQQHPGQTRNIRSTPNNSTDRSTRR
jgi:hypothetical protein